MRYSVTKGFLNEKYCHQLEAHEIALNVDVGLDKEAEGEIAMQWGAQSYFPTFHCGESLFQAPVKSYSEQSLSLFGKNLVLRYNLPMN